MNAWMNSSGHRANILSGSKTHFGAGWAKSSNKWTQVFSSTWDSTEGCITSNTPTQNPATTSPVNPPTLPPVNPPTLPPVNPPTLPPVIPPTTPPVIPPTTPPVIPPTTSPFSPPTTSPVCEDTQEQFKMRIQRKNS